MSRKNLFHSTSLQLTVIYLCIVLCISLTFSAVVYRVSSDELENSINRPLSQSERRLLVQEGLDAAEDLQQERKEEFIEAEQRLVNRLIFINLIIVFAGGALSYVLARSSLKPIEQAHEAQSRFTADASHELRTPITAMRAETELALTDPKLTLKTAKEQLKSNIEELDKLTTLSEGLLQLARMETDSLETSHVALDHLIAQSVERVQMTIGKKSQSIQLPKPLDIQVNVHQTTIVEAIVTVLENASKYSPGESTVTIKTGTQKSMAKIDIIDKGAGIKASELPYIFDRFYRADSSRSSASSQHGYGIGLSIAQQAVQASGGSITAKSKPMHGSTFTILLPIK